MGNQSAGDNLGAILDDVYNKSCRRTIRGYGRTCIATSAFKCAPRHRRQGPRSRGGRCFDSSETEHPVPTSNSPRAPDAPTPTALISNGRKEDSNYKSWVKSDQALTKSSRGSGPRGCLDPGLPDFTSRFHLMLCEANLMASELFASTFSWPRSVCVTSFSCRPVVRSRDTQGFPQVS